MVMTTRNGGIIMFKKFIAVFLTALCVIALAGCSYDQEDYYEVHVVEGTTTFRYVNPDDGKELHSKDEFANEDTYFIYLYAPAENETFTYARFFSPLGDHFVYKSTSTGKYYIKYSAEMESIVFQFYVDKEAFENPA
jgi:hypothetical protein